MLYPDEEQIPRQPGEPRDTYEQRVVQITRDEKLQAIQQAIAELPEDRITWILDALADVVDDLVQRKFV